MNISRPPTRFVNDSGEEVSVPWGGGTEKREKNGGYVHKWEDGYWYKYPEVPITTFEGLVNPRRMLLFKAESLEEVLNNPRAFVEDLTRLCLVVKVPPFLWGPYGSGKTKTAESFEQEMDETGKPYFVSILKLMETDASVIMGMHYTSLGEDGHSIVMKRSTPELAFSIVATYRETGRLTVLLIDEFTVANRSQQNTSLFLLTDGKFGDFDVSRYATIMVAANPKKTVRNVIEADRQVLNRGAHFAWYSDHRHWLPKWKRGFVHEDQERRPEKEPDQHSKWFATQLLNTPPPGVQPFRPSEEKEKKWTPDNLLACLKDLEQTERSLDMYMSVFALVNRIAMGRVPDEIRHHYLSALARALMGKKWSESVDSVLAQERTAFLGFEEIAERVQSIEMQTPAEEAMRTLEESNIDKNSSGEELDLSQKQDVMNEAEKHALDPASDPDTRRSAVVVAWAVLTWALHCGDSQTASWAALSVSDIVQGIAALDPSAKERVTGELGGKIMPDFASTEAKSAVRENIRNRS